MVNQSVETPLSSTTSLVLLITSRSTCCMLELLAMVTLALPAPDRFIPPVQARCPDHDSWPSSEPQVTVTEVCCNGTTHTTRLSHVQRGSLATYVWLVLKGLSVNKGADSRLAPCHLAASGCMWQTIVCKGLLPCVLDCPRTWPSGSLAVKRRMFSDSQRFLEPIYCLVSIQCRDEYRGRLGHRSSTHASQAT